MTLESLAEVVAQMETASPLTLAMLDTLLDEVRPSQPFDLEPRGYREGAAAISIAAAEREDDLRRRYDDCRLWHRLKAHIANLRA